MNIFNVQLECLRLLSVNADVSDTDSTDEEGVEDENTLDHIQALIEELCQVKHSLFL